MTGIKRRAPRYQEIVVDTDGRDTASQRIAPAVCHTSLIPFVARSFDIWSLGRAVALNEEPHAINLDKARAFLNRADSRGSENSCAADHIRTKPAPELLPAVLVGRNAFGSAQTVGKAVTEIRPKDAQAFEEIGILFEHLFGIPRFPPSTAQ
ncbi:hypothetical protein ILT44_29125 [Microvirga sp. BT689]|uniref:hypothetical protein n=1 Tax=Microvirga arvi TaxID=2778731 RepID=UPI00194FA360|nr:hypothetical protein [Microvirga arvi]MBM6584262.1 hypothetical protein [Microvirga arvi]